MSCQNRVRDVQDVLAESWRTHKQRLGAHARSDGERGRDRSCECLQDGGRGRNFSVLGGDCVCYVCVPDPLCIALGWQESLGKGAEAELRQISVVFIC